MGSSAALSLPLPADPPHCGRYSTRFEQLFAARQDDAARQLNELLPLLHDEIELAARLVGESSDWLHLVSERRDPATDGTGLLRAYELMALRRREFVNVVWEYNTQIAAYAELATPDDVDADRLVAMLIRVSSVASRQDSASGAKEDAKVVPAGAMEDVGGQESMPPSDSGAVRNRSGTPRTFAWRPLERLRSRERSIVVRRLRLGGSRRD
jgi:hypothetical protein